MFTPLLLMYAAHALPPPVADFWTSVPAAARRQLGQPRFRPTRYLVLHLDAAAAKRYLRQVPAEGSAPTPLALPLPDGTKRAFRLQRSAVMAPELAAKYPELQTFSGQDVSDAAANVRLELSPAGLRIQIIGYGSTFLTEPYGPAGPRYYLCFDKASLPAGSKQWKEPASQR